MLNGIALTFVPPPAIIPAAALLAYVGPGLGAGAIAFLGGVVFSVFLTLFAVIYYPIKRLLRNLRKKREAVPSTDLETS